jgi:uncharacterized membrane protein YdjX (TVP38/TMEM64 family)
VLKHRRVVLLVWIALLSGALYLYFFHAQEFLSVAAQLTDAPPGWAYLGYLVLGCVRGFTLIPATYLVLAGLLVFPPWPLFALTLGGILVSSAAVYRFAEAMQLDSFFNRRYPRQLSQLTALLRRRELPIVVAWSFLPIAPTDLVCYVCGALKVDLKKCLVGVAIGEGAICAIYIFVGGRAIDWLG